MNKTLKFSWRFRSTDRVTDPAHKLKHCGVRIYSVGVGYNFDIKQLETMSSRPVSENVFIGPFNKLQYIRNDLVRSVCYGELISFFDHLQTEPFFFKRCCILLRKENTRLLNSFTRSYLTVLKFYTCVCMFYLLVRVSSSFTLTHLFSIILSRKITSIFRFSHQLFEILSLFLLWT